MKLISTWLDATGMREEGVSAPAVEAALRDLLDTLGDLPDTFDADTFYRYRVPMLSEDGSCAVIDALAPTPYDLGGILGGRADATTRKLRLIDQLVDRAGGVTGSDWVGIYQRRPKFDGTEVLVKLAYRGRPSRAEFPLTETFARGSTNSSVGLTGKARVIPDVDLHVQQGGGFYVCDAAVKSEACLPILSTDGSRVAGILDAEAAPKNFYSAERLAVLSATCLLAANLLP